LDHSDKKLIAWGAGPLLEIFTKYYPDHGFAFCIDSNHELHGTTLNGMQIVSPEALSNEEKGKYFIAITAFSSTAIQSIQCFLSDHGYILGQDFADLAFLIKDMFKIRAEAAFNKVFSEEYFVFARAFNLNSLVPLQTTILGNWLLLEALDKTRQLNGAVAEIGAYKGGNAQLLLSAMSLWKDNRRYYVLDSFEGFPDLSGHDPTGMQDSYNYDYKRERIFNALAGYPLASVYPGFVPQTFSQIPDDSKFSLVFYDCDLYQPALDSYAFFWERLLPGGILVIHDNIATPKGWTGVRLATQEFFNPLGIPYIDFPETTMSIIFK
jgi:hypothetical protein